MVGPSAFVSEYFTSEHYGPVKSISAQSETGPATVVIEGIAQGKLSTLPSVGIVALMIGLSFWMGGAAFGSAGDVIGLYGVSLAAIGMLAVTGVIVAVDAYGPIADNAGGIAEMAELPGEVREVTDSLDALGNTTAAVAKGFAVGSAAVTALALFKSFSLTAGSDVNLRHQRYCRHHRLVPRRDDTVHLRGPDDGVGRSCGAGDDRRSPASVRRDPRPP